MAPNRVKSSVPLRMKILRLEERQTDPPVQRPLSTHKCCGGHRLVLCLSSWRFMFFFFFCFLTQLGPLLWSGQVQYLPQPLINPRREVGDTASCKCDCRNSNGKVKRKKKKKSLLEWNRDCGFFHKNTIDNVVDVVKRKSLLQTS